jgi:hypothetical protein
MINKLPYLLVSMICIWSSSLAQMGFEQYYYMTHDQVKSPVSIVNYESPKHLYTEIRHNYEAINTLSIYLGETFSNKGNVEYSITPIIGVLMGKLKGGSIGVNVFVEHKKFFLSTQSQYTFASHEKKENFFFAWSELAFQPRPWFFIGLSTQHTYSPKAKSWILESGLVTGISHGKWTFPIYSFNPLNTSRYFMVGINFNGGLFKRKK